MTRFFNVLLVSTSGDKFRFQAIITSKKQEKGRLGGDVEETLFFDALLFERLTPKKKVLVSKNIETLRNHPKFLNKNEIMLTKGRHVLQMINSLAEAEGMTSPDMEMGESIEFTIYCGYQESKDILEQIISLLNEELDGYTIVNSLGYWMGEEEKSLKIMILGNIEDINKMREICKKINVLANQESVLLTYDKVDNSEFIYGRKFLIIKA